MSFSNYFLAIMIFLLLLMPAMDVSAGTLQESAITGDGAVLELAGSAFWNNAYYVDAVGDYAFLTMDFGLMIVDVSNKADPQVASRLYLPSATSRLHVVGDFAYVCGGGDLSTGTDWATLTIVDISDVYNPFVEACYQGADSVVATGVKVVDGNAYLVGGSRLYLVRVSNPPNIYQMSYLQDTYMCDVDVIDDTAFVTGPHRIYAADVSDPWNPDFIYASIQIGGGGANGIEVANDLVYLANGDSGLTIMDPYHGAPYVLSNFPLDSGHWSWCMSRDLVLVDDTIVFIGGELSNTMKVLNVADPYAVDSIGKCGSGGQYARGMDLDGDYLYVARYEDGLFINNVSNRTWPMEVGVFRECQDEPVAIEVRGNTGYVAFQDTIRIVDLSDPANITQIGWAELGMNDALAIVGDVMLVGNTNGMTSFDISNPASPVLLSFCSTGNHYVKSIDVRGDYAYITMWRWGYGIVDISDPNNLVMAGSYVDADYWPTDYNEGNSTMILVDGYALSGFYSPESLQDGFLVLDVSDPTNPQPVKEHTLPHEVACLTLMDSLLYFAHGGSDSMFVWDISDVLSPIHVASWRPPGFSYFHSNIISHAGGYILVEERYSHTLLAVDPSGWSGSSSGGEVARFRNNRPGNDIATGGNHIYMTSLGGLVALTLELDFVCGDVNGDGGFTPNIADLTYLVAYLFAGGPPPPNLETADINGGDGKINIADLTYFVAYLFGGGPNPVCW